MEAANTFENCVNFTGDKTMPDISMADLPFENCVNFTGDKTSDVRPEAGAVV